MDNIIINLDEGIRLGDDTLPRIGDQSSIISQSDTIVGPAGPQGPAGPAGQDGQAATITVGTTTTGAAGTNAIVQNSGTSSAVVLDFTIPRGATGATGPQGEKGDTGDAGADGAAATITVGSVNTVAYEYPATVTNSGTVNAAILDFDIPRGQTGDTGPAGADGQAATISVGSTTTGAAGTNASVTNSGTSSAAVLDFVIPRGADGNDGQTGPAGADGQAATIAVGTTTTGAAGTNASVTNSGTSSAAVFNFTIPRGADGNDGQTGPAGADGAAATIAVGTTATLPAGSNATVTNSGTSSAAVFNFGIPKGSDADMSGETVSLSSYITASSGYTFTDNGCRRFGKLVVLNFSVSGTIGTGETNCGTCTNNIICDAIGAGKTAAWNQTNRPASVFLIKNGSVRIYSVANNTAAEFTAIVIET